MDIKLLKTFLSVARLKNFSAAARELHTVQPTVSRHISDLESELDVKLFARTTHQVELTPAGEVLLTEAQAILDNDLRVKKLVRQSANSRSESIKIGYLATASSFFLPKMVGQFTKSRANVLTDLKEMNVLQQLNALNKDQIDVAFCRRMSKVDSDLFDIIEIYSDRLMAYLPKNHPLAEREELDLSELKQEKFILFHRTDWIEMYEHIQTLCKESGFTPNIVCHPNNMRHLSTSVSAGLGISIAPQCIQFVAEDDCVCVPIKQINLVLPLYMYVRRQREANAIAEFVELCKQNINQIRSALTQH